MQIVQTPLPAHDPSRSDLWHRTRQRFDGTVTYRESVFFFGQTLLSPTLRPEGSFSVVRKSRTNDVQIDAVVRHSSPCKLFSCKFNETSVLGNLRSNGGRSAHPGFRFLFHFIIAISKRVMENHSPVLPSRTVTNLIDYKLYVYRFWRTRRFSMEYKSI